MSWTSFLAAARTAWRKGRQREALQHCDRAALCGPEARYAAAVLRGQFLLSLGDPAGALSSLDTVADVSVPDPELDSARGVALFELGHLAEAENALRSAIRGRPDLAEAHHTLGLITEIQGTGEEIECFRAARRLDPERYPPAPRLAPEQFEEIVERALSRLPQSVRLAMADIPVIIVELPQHDDLRRCEPPLSPRALGACVDLGAAARLHVPFAPAASQAMVLFKRNLERACRDKAAMKAAIRATVVGEVSHALGLLHPT